MLASFLHTCQYRKFAGVVRYGWYREKWPGMSRQGQAYFMQRIDEGQSGALGC